MSDLTTTRIGWVGLGKMGLPMAARVLAAGHPVGIYERSPKPETTRRLLPQGAFRVDSLPGLAATSDVVVSTVSDDAALGAVTIEAGGLFEAARPGLVFVDMSTVSPAQSQRVAERAAALEVQYIRAPVSGSTSSAAAGALTVLASGPEAAFQRIECLLKCFASKLYYVGEGEESRYLKLAINAMLGITAAMVGEALTLAERGNVDWGTTIEVINNSVVASPLFGYKAEMLHRREFTPMFSAAQMAKDFDLALDTARSAGVPMPLTALARQFVGAMISTGRGEQDFFGYVMLMEELAGSQTNKKRDM